MNPFWFLVGTAAAAHGATKDNKKVLEYSGGDKRKDYMSEKLALYIKYKEVVGEPMRDIEKKPGFIKEYEALNMRYWGSKYDYHNPYRIHNRD